MTIECFVLLLIMMNSTNDKSKDIQDFLKKIKESGDEDKFKEMLNKMPVAQKVENFLNNQQMMAMHDYQKDPELYKTAKEIFETPGYDPASKAEAKRQLDLMDARFTKISYRHNEKCFPNNIERDIKMH